MRSLTKRPRVRRVVERAAERGLRAVGAQDRIAPPGGPSEPPLPAEPPPQPEPPPPPEPPAPSPADFNRDIPAALPPVDGGPVTSTLFERLDTSVASAVERQIRETPDLDAHYTMARGETERRQLVLAYGAWINAPGLLEATGIGAEQPPEDVHAMARGPLAAAGGVYEADMVVEALKNAGIPITSVNNALDFGCSSGRVVRVLRAAFPNTNWSGCDPNDAAIAWATENLPGIGFFVNADEPPLPLEDDAMDLVYAISIWSHFEPSLGLRWFEEMHRVIAPGGHLVCTTHGLTSVEYYATRELRSPLQSRDIADSLYGGDAWYAPEFGDEGDWGVVNPGWGTAFLSPEWILTQLCPRWRVLEFAPGRNQLNQDIYVLERV